MIRNRHYRLLHPALNTNRGKITKKKKKKKDDAQKQVKSLEIRYQVYIFFHARLS